MCYLNENTTECAKECQVPISLRTSKNNCVLKKMFTCISFFLISVLKWQKKKQKKKNNYGQSHTKSVNAFSQISRSICDIYVLFSKSSITLRTVFSLLFPLSSSLPFFLFSFILSFFPCFLSSFFPESA